MYVCIYIYIHVYLYYPFASLFDVDAPRQVDIGREIKRFLAQILGDYGFIHKSQRFDVNTSSHGSKLIKLP